MLNIKKVQYYPAIDFLRGLGAIVILIWHYHHFYFEKPYYGPTNGVPSWDFYRQPFYDILLLPYHYGSWAVHFFWMISGFVFAFVYIQKSVSGKEFFILRFSRLYPLHFFSLIFIATLQFISMRMVGDYQILEYNDPYHFLLNLFFAQHWGLESGYSFNSPSWSISVEEIVYWGFWLIVIKYHVRNIYGIILISLLAFFSYPLFGIFSFAFFFFWGGALIYLIHSKISTRANLLFSMLALTSAISVAIFIKFLPTVEGYLMTEQIINFKDAVMNLFFFLIFSTLIFIFAYIDKVGVLSEKFSDFCRAVGSLTYSTYMLHLPIQVMMLIVWDYYSFSRSIFDSEVVFIVYIVTMIAIGRLSFVYLEKPIQKKIRQNFL